MFCKVCGKELADNAIFCGNCGTKVEREDVAEKVEAVAETVTEEVTEAVEVAEEVVDKAEAKIEEEVATVFEAAEDKAQTAFEEMASAVEEKVAPVVEKVEEVMSATPVTPVAEPTPVVAPLPVAPEVNKAEVKAEAKAAKAEAKAAKAEAKAARKRLMVKRNTVFSSIACVFLSLVVTAVMFATAAVAVLCTKEFDDFYYSFISANRAEFDVFWILTSVWYLYALAAVLVLLILLILSMIKRRKYAIFNYIGIPMIVNGSIFVLVALLNKWIVDTFDFPELLNELMTVIGDEAKNTVLFAGIILLAAGVFFVLLYILISVIHKAAYRKKCVKAQSNQ